MAANASAQLRAVAAQLRAAGDRENVNALRRGVRKAAAPAVAALRASAQDKLPKSGGLNDYVARQRITVSTRLGARTAGVRLVAQQHRDQFTSNSGYVRHPVWGHRDRWSTTEVDPGWWDNALAEYAPAVTPGIVAELEAVAARIQGA